MNAHKAASTTPRIGPFHRRAQGLGHEQRVHDALVFAVAAVEIGNSSRGLGHGERRKSLTANRIRDPVSGQLGFGKNPLLPLDGFRQTATIYSGT